MTLSSAPWRVAIGIDDAMKDWLVADMGADREGRRIFIVTDKVPASAAVSRPMEDAEAIVAWRNAGQPIG